MLKMAQPTAGKGFIPAVGRKLDGFGKAIAGNWKEPFYFVQATDIQFGFMNIGRPGKGWGWEIERAKECVKAVNNLVPKPKFLIMTGDLVNAFPGDPEKEPQEKDFKEIFAKLEPSIPFFCFPGNHDIGQTPTSKSISDYKRSFGDDYYSFWVDGVKFVAPNTQYLKDPSQVASLKEEHDHWLSGELFDEANKGSKHVILLQHIPWFHTDPEEKEDMFNIPHDEREKWLVKIKEAGVRYVFTGHLHRNAGGVTGDLEIIVTSAAGRQLGKEGPGFRIVKVADDKVTHKYFTLDNPPTTVDVNIPF